MISKASHWSCFKALVLCSCSTLGMEVLSQIIIWRLQLFDNIWCTISRIEIHLSMSLIHVVNIVLMLVVLYCLSVMLILEDFCQDSFCASRNTWVINSATTTILNAHTSTMNSIELILCIVGSWGSLTSSSSWIWSTLCNWWPLNIQFGRLARYQILSLITAWLNHESLIHSPLVLISANRARVNRLPCILGIVLNLAMGTDLHHAVYECLIILSWVVSSRWTVVCLIAINKVLLPLSIFLRD